MKGFLDRRRAHAERRGAATRRAPQRLSAAGAVCAAEPHGFARHRPAGVDDRQRRPAAVLRSRTGSTTTPASRRGMCRLRRPQAERHERRIQRLVALLQMTYVGPPMIYYGTEAGMWGADDPCDRMPMVWPELTYDAASRPTRSAGRGRPMRSRSTTTLFNFYRAAIALRRDSPGAAARRHRVRRDRRRGPVPGLPADGRASRHCWSASIAATRRSTGRFRSPKMKRSSQIFTASGERRSVHDRAQRGERRSSPCRPATASCCGFSPRSDRRA